VADEQEIAVVVGDRRRVRVIGGQGNDGFTALAGGDVWRHDAPALEVNGHYSPIGPARAPDMAPAKPRRGRALWPSLRNRSGGRQRTRPGKSIRLVNFTNCHPQNTRPSRQSVELAQHRETCMPRRSSTGIARPDFALITRL